MSRVLPILFNTEMVRAILNGKKTVTRRVMKPQPWKIGEGEYECRHEKGFYDMGGNEWACRQCGCGVIPMKGGSYFHAPYQPGDILYVRETWCNANIDGVEPDYYYYADVHICEDYNRTEWKWRPSIHMPKEAARIWLKVTDVRVERLQDITGAEILAEGVDNGKSNPTMGKRWENMQRIAFENLWKSTLRKSDLGRYGWDANPWVWVIEFERCGKPKDWR